jgi:hypothetical protein
MYNDCLLILILINEPNKSNSKTTELLKITLPVTLSFINFFAIYLKLLLFISVFIKKIYSTKQEQFFNTLELIIGQITAMKFLIFSDSGVAD